MTLTYKALRERLLEEKQRLNQEIDGLEQLYADGQGTTTEYEHYGNHPADIGTETFEQEKNWP